MPLQPAPNGAVFWAQETVFCLLTVASSLREAIAVHNFSRSSWGRGAGVFPIGTEEPVSVSTFCSGAELVCQKETLVNRC